MRVFVYKAILILFLLILLIFVIGRIKAISLDTEESRLYINDLPASFTGYKLVHFSDLHIKCDSNLDRLKKVIDELNQIDPEILVFNGDLINGKCSTNFNNSVVQILNELDHIVYKFVVYGDEDLEGSSKIIFRELSFIELENRVFTIVNKEMDTLNLIGISDKKINNRIYQNLTDSTTLLFSHLPNNLSSVDLTKVDLAFTAHTHLGEIFSPFSGGLIKVDGAASIGYQPYEEVHGLGIYTSRGIGTKNLNIRYFNNPTIHLYRLDVGN